MMWVLLNDCMNSSDNGILLDLIIVIVELVDMFDRNILVCVSSW